MLRHASRGRWDATLRSGFDSQRNDLRWLGRAEHGDGDAWQSGGSAEHGVGVAAQRYAALRDATAKHCDASQWRGLA